MAGELVMTEGKRKPTTRFDVEVETSNGTPLIVFQDLVAQTKAEAINRAKQMLTFSAERSK